MSKPTSQHSQADQIYAAKVLNAMAGKVTNELSAFSTWMIAAAAAVFAVALNGVDKLGPYLQLDAMSSSIKIFLVAAAFNVLQRWLGALVAGSVAVGKEIGEMPAPQTLQIKSIFEMLEGAAIWPVKYWMRWSIRQVTNGDYTVGAKLNSRLAQIQSWLVLLQMAMVIVAAWRLLPP